MEYKFLKYGRLFSILIIFTCPSLYLNETLDDKYINIYGNDPANPNGKWPLIELINQHGILGEVCARIDKEAKRRTHVFIMDAKIEEGTLKLVGATSIVNPNPMSITMVKYWVAGLSSYIYITKGFNQASVLYLLPLDEERTQFVITDVLYYSEALRQLAQKYHIAI